MEYLIQTENLPTIDSATLVMLLTINTIGESILVQAFREAKYYMNFTGSRPSKSIRESYLFINGTGLDAVIEDYQLDYDATSLRSIFFWKVKHENTLM